MFVSKWKYDQLKEDYENEVKETTGLERDLETQKKRYERLESEYKKSRTFQDEFSIKIWCDGVEEPIVIDGVTDYRYNHHNLSGERYGYGYTSQDMIVCISLFGQQNRFIANFNNVIAFVVVKG